MAGNLEGALGAGTSSALIPIIGDEIAKLDIPEALKQSLVMATAGAIGASTGGLTGAGAALSEATNNYLTHNEVKTLSEKLKACKSSECVNNLLRDAILLSESRDGKDLTNRVLYEAAHAGTIDLITLALLDPNQSFMIRQAASILLGINMDDEGTGQQYYSAMLASQLALSPSKRPTIGAVNSSIVSPEKYAQNAQDAIMAGYVIGTLSGAMVMSTPVISFRNAIIANTTINTGSNVYSQLDKYGEIKYPTELAINAGFGALEGVLGKYSGSGWRGVGIEALIGASSNVAAALTVEQYYQYDSDHQVDRYGLLTTGLSGAIFGAGAKAADEYQILQYLKQFLNRNGI